MTRANPMKNLFSLRNMAAYLLVACVVLIWACNKKVDVTPTPTPTPTTKSSAKAITKFSFAALSPAVDATIDAAAKTISATVPAVTDITKLVPTITISDKATVSPASGVAQDFSKEVSYTVTAEDASTQVWKVNVIKAIAPKSSAKNILTFAFNATSPAVKAIVDTTAKTIVALLPAGTDVTRLVPMLTVSEKATVSPATGVAQDFTKEITYTVTAEDGTKKEFLVKAATDAYYYSNIRMTVAEDVFASDNDSSLLDIKTGKVFMLKNGATNANGVDLILNGYCSLQFYSPAAVIFCGVSCGVGAVNAKIVAQKWPTYRKAFIDNIVKNEVKAGTFHAGQIASSEWDKLNFAADISNQFNLGRSLNDPDVYLDGQSTLSQEVNDCIPTAVIDKVLYRFVTQEGKRGLIKIKSLGKKGKGYFIVFDIKVQK